MQLHIPATFVPAGNSLDATRTGKLKEAPAFRPAAAIGTRGTIPQELGEYVEAACAEGEAA